MKIILLAAGLMLVYEVFEALIVQAEARDHPALTAFIKAFTFPTFFLVTYFGIDQVKHGDLRMQILTILIINLGNVVGAGIGVTIGRRYIKRPKALPMADF